MAYFSEKRQQEAFQRDESTNIHDIPPEGGFYPDEYGLLLTDISHETPEDRVSEELGIDYLSEANDEAKKPVSMCDGYIFDRNKRSMVALVTYEERSHWASFVVDTESP